MAIKASRGMKVLITRCCIYLIASLSCKVFESAFDVTSNHAKGTRQGGSVLDRIGTGLLVICLEKKREKIIYHGIGLMFLAELQNDDKFLLGSFLYGKLCYEKQVYSS